LKARGPSAGILFRCFGAANLVKIAHWSELKGRGFSRAGPSH
jgi:hypothetical protein